MASNTPQDVTAGLTPSQAISSQSQTVAGEENQQKNQYNQLSERNGNKKKRWQPKRRTGQRNNNRSTEVSSSPPEGEDETNNNGRNNKNNKNNNNMSRKNNKNQNNNSNNNKNINNNNNNSGSNSNNNGDTTANSKKKNNKKNNNKNNGKFTQSVENGVKGGNNKSGRRGRHNNKGRKRFPWRRYIPQGTYDPITLDALVSLPYPPFALVATEPYVPVEEWPVPQTKQRESEGEDVDKNVKQTIEERQRRIMEEQWGKSFINEKQSAEQQKDELKAETATNRHYHLYDGKALAYYMVSQLQFIDPLNRRDVTREELVNLDRYLKRHKFNDVNVVEAYDTKGISLSTAGAAGNTAAGRVEILQQEARLLFDALFISNNQSRAAALAPPPQQNPQNNSLQAQYAAYQAHHDEQHHLQQPQSQRPATTETTSITEDTGIYGGQGFIVIDDDTNPGLRGNTAPFVEQGMEGNVENSVPNTLWSASHIASRYAQTTIEREEAFPALSTTPAAAYSRSESEEQLQQQKQPAKKPAPTSSTLKLIGKAIKKTTAEETQRQWEAREEARKRAMLANLTFGSNPASWDMPDYLAKQQLQPSVSGTGTKVLPSDGQLERNRAFAEALDVTPATVRSANYKAGWARPTEGKIVLDEFGNELNASLYPETLILGARERMGQLLKLEKKWKVFLEDDSSASMPLNSMDRPMRAFVHEYSDFWRLHTESFDPEPRRYIHCVKMRDTAAPFPLLSDAARNWRGPRPMVSSLQFSNTSGSDHASQQTAGQTTQGREISPPSWKCPSQRVPLPLKPRSTDRSEAATSSVAITSNTSKDVATIQGDRPNSRFDALVESRERPRLELQKRTRPLELPPFKSPEKSYHPEELHRQRETKMQENNLKKRQQKENEIKILEAAFASSDEEEAMGGADSDWEEAEEIFPGSDSEH